MAVHSIPAPSNGCFYMASLLTRINPPLPWTRTLTKRLVNTWPEWDVVWITPFWENIPSGTSHRINRDRAKPLTREKLESQNVKNRVKKRFLNETRLKNKDLFPSPCLFFHPQPPTLTFFKKSLKKKNYKLFHLRQKLLNGKRKCSREYQLWNVCSSLVALSPSPVSSREKPPAPHPRPRIGNWETI